MPFFCLTCPKKENLGGDEGVVSGAPARESLEVIGDNGRYNHADVDDDRQRLSNEKTLVSKQRVERSQN